MGVAGMTWDEAMVEAALFRSGGVKLESYAYGPAPSPNAADGLRSYKAQGSGVGHVYIHVHGTGNETVGNNAGLGKNRVLPTRRPRSV